MSCNVFKSNKLTIASFLALAIGVILGTSLRYAKESAWSKRQVMYVKYIALLIIQMLKGLTTPIIVPSIIVAVGSLKPNFVGKIGGRALGYYIMTTVVAVIVGINLVLLIKPGSGMTYNAKAAIENRVEKDITSEDILLDFVRNMFPANFIQAFTQQLSTQLIYSNETDDKNDWDFKVEFRDSTNTLGLIMFSFTFGLALSSIGPKGQPLLDILIAFNDVIAKMTSWIINLAPIAITFALTASIIDIDDPKETFSKLAWYIATVLIGIVVHAGLLSLVYGIFTRSWPFRYVKNLGSALATAFATRSSAAALPLTLNALETKNKVDCRITRFIFPVGALVNMDGCAVYSSVTAIFLAQVNGVTLNAGQAAAMSITATFASIGAAFGPGAGMVATIIVLNTVGIASKQMALVFAIDWLLDGARTALNVLGDCIGAAVVQQLSKEQLETSEASV